MAALSIDLMLPAFPDARADFGLAADSTQTSWIITAFFLGLAAGQLVYGPLSDRHGRKPLLYAGLGIMTLGAALCAVAPSLGSLIVARVLWGLGAAGPRSLALAMVRDRYSGDRMARTMSHIMATFVLVPVLAPGTRLDRADVRAVADAVLDPGAGCHRRRLLGSPPARDAAARTPPAARTWRASGRRLRGRAHPADGRLRHRPDLPVRHHVGVHRELRVDHRRGVRPQGAVPDHLRCARPLPRRRLVHQRPAGRAGRAVPHAPRRRHRAGRRRGRDGDDRPGLRRGAAAVPVRRCRSPCSCPSSPC